MKNFSLGRQVLWLALAILSAASMGFYTARIWSANQPPGFNDLYARWWGAHELLLHGRDPYSPAVSHEIQSVIYGAPVAPSPEDPAGIGGGFAYPPYAALFYWPTVHLSFHSAQRVFVVVSILAALLSLVVWMCAFHFRAPPLIWFAVIIFAMGSFPALQGLALQNPSLIAAALIAITISLLARDRLVMAGIFLAVSTFKPQFVVTLIPWLALWSLADWRRRHVLAYSFSTTMGLLALWSEWVVPGWIPSFLHIIRAYSHYTYGHSLIDVWFTPTFGPVVSAVLLLACLAVCWTSRSDSAGSPRFLVATSLLLAANVVVIPTLAPHAQLLLFPGFLSLLSGPAFFGRSNLWLRVLLRTTWLLLAWPWLATFGMLLLVFVYATTTLIRFWEIPLYTSPLLPLAVLLALCAGMIKGKIPDQNLDPHPSQIDPTSAGSSR